VVKVPLFKFKAYLGGQTGQLNRQNQNSNPYYHYQDNYADEELPPVYGEADYENDPNGGYQDPNNRKLS
jgi:hypothetical protein